MTNPIEEARIELDAVRREYDQIVALDGVSLCIRPGELHCLVGPNGSGKTTLFRILLGLAEPSSGTVRRPSATVGVGFQRPVFYPDLTVAENLHVFGRLVDAPADGWRKKVRERLALERVTHRRAGALSGGYAKKLDLALALLKHPQFLLLDEPLTNLDETSRTAIVSLLGEYAQAGNAVFVSTHRIDDFATSLDRLSVLRAGRIVCERTRAELRADGRAVTAQYNDLVDRDRPTGDGWTGP